MPIWPIYALHLLAFTSPPSIGQVYLLPLLRAFLRNEGINVDIEARHPQNLKVPLMILQDRKHGGGLLKLLECDVVLLQWRSNLWQPYETFALVNLFPSFLR